MECLVLTQAQSQGMASLTAGDNTMSKIRLKPSGQSRTLENRNDLGLRLFRSESIQEEIDVGGWVSSTVEVFAKGSFGSLVSIRNGQKASQSRSSSNDDITPIKK